MSVTPLDQPPALTRWIWAGSRCAPALDEGGELLVGSSIVSGREATVKVCGVAVAMPQGYSRAPHPSTGQQ